MGLTKIESYSSHNCVLSDNLRSNASHVTSMSKAEANCNINRTNEIIASSRTLF